MTERVRQIDLVVRVELDGTVPVEEVVSAVGGLNEAGPGWRVVSVARAPTVEPLEADPTPWIDRGHERLRTEEPE